MKSSWVDKYLPSLEKFGIDLGLDRIRQLLCALDAPQLEFNSIHVAGTNGKGSTCAMIAQILKEAGYAVGLYTSPHLLKFNERIKVNGKDITDQALSAAVNSVRRVAEKLKIRPTVFEVLTAAAFLYFAQRKVDYAVIEVGMGGRLDATNVIIPLAAVITNIDYEHTAILGKTLGKIAREKAAIIKPGRPAITAETKPEPLKVMKKIARENGSLLIKVGPIPPGLHVNLIGTHQRRNAACAVAAIRLAGIKVKKDDIKRGLKKVFWPARFQVISRRPLTIVDGAHNPAGIRVLVQALRDNFPGRKFNFIIGVQKDKDSAVMLKEIKPLAREIIVTRSSHHYSAPGMGGQKAVDLRRALENIRGKDRVITGSLFLAGDVFKNRLSG